MDNSCPRIGLITALFKPHPMLSYCWCQGNQNSSPVNVITDFLRAQPRYKISCEDGSIVTSLVGATAASGVFSGD